MGSSPTRGSSFVLHVGKVTALGVLCCFALFVCLTLLASFFLPSHLSLKTCIVQVFNFHVSGFAMQWLDQEEKERLIQRFNMTPTRSNSRKHIDQASRAVTLARRLYMLDGFKKSEVAEKLADP